MERILGWMLAGAIYRLVATRFTFIIPPQQEPALPLLLLFGVCQFVGARVMISILPVEQDPLLSMLYVLNRWISPFLAGVAVVSLILALSFGERRYWSEFTILTCQSLVLGLGLLPDRPFPPMSGPRK